MGLIAQPLGWLLTQLYNIVGSYGVALAIVTLIVKMALYPLYKKQIMATAGMTDLQPKMQELQKKYANDRETLNEKMQELYKEEGFNPMGGCLPMIVQMVVIMGLFALLRNPMIYIHSEQMYFAIHESFLWIRDLSQPDLWVLPILAGVATFFSSWLTRLANPTPQNSNVMMKMMMYFFPIMIVWLARAYPAGLAVYWFVGQFIQIFFNLRFNKLRKDLKEKNKSVKKKKKKKVVGGTN